MISKQTRHIAHELLSSVPIENHPARAYIYGSRARGNADPHSDLDILIEVKGDIDRMVKNTVREKAWELSLAYEFVISPVVVSKANFEDGPLAHSGFARNVRKEGTIVAA